MGAEEEEVSSKVVGKELGGAVREVLVVRVGRGGGDGERIGLG